MSKPDLNLLSTLHVLLEEGSVAQAARRLQLSPSAMSRALARLRHTTGDPLLVRAGRRLVPTPRALILREQVGQLVLEAQAVLRPAEQLDLGRLTRTFTLRSRDGFVENFGAALITRISREAPGVKLHFVQKWNKDPQPLRDGSVDLDIGVVGETTSPELRARALFQDRFIGVVRAGHAWCDGHMTPQRYAAGQHIQVSRRGDSPHYLDDAMNAIGLTRTIVTSVSNFSAALALARQSDLIATVPEYHTRNLRHGLFGFPLPVPLADMTVSMLWHPRMDGDLAHRWLRDCLRAVCTDDPARPHIE
ncbi:LysR family transcriptional regulator [Musicola paradisiaca]|uniref:Transcriptional regulator, LysR family n=1 Tax=Musicola paradisiaca (strain Ech703) TaxID=579405 RepID=C6CDK2_MUSP7|nr:LysR family transcriptional regulator [Musicola paradisiaca]ACS85119.1 transcriptional regulator, LysR family [Musicola paradisiaca Ech703]